MAEAASNATPPVYHRKNPYLAAMTLRESLTKPGSNKDTRHLVLSLEDSGITYTPGDSLAVFARNPPALVEALLRQLGLPADAAVPDTKGGTTTFREALARNYILNRAGKKILHTLHEHLAAGPALDRLQQILASEAAVAEYLYPRDYLDVLTEFPAVKFDSPAAFLAQLSPIPPRLYSIASSLAAHPGEVHLCVGAVRYETFGRKRTGLASGYLVDQAALHTRDIPVYVQESRHFRLPADGARDIIMIGPGTGIAPFRAFLEQRAGDGARGRHWLIFGEQHRATDFLYETDLAAWQKRGVLHRLDTAFSRDQAAKIYVQDRMREHARELWAWLQSGAYFYVCGDARRMAKDVHQALLDLARQEGRLSVEAADEYINVTLMKTEKRYLRDVY